MSSDARTPEAGVASADPDPKDSGPSSNASERDASGAPQRQATDAEDHVPAPPGPTQVRFRLSDFLAGHRLGLASVAGSALVGGLLEAAFLVLMTRAAFAISDGNAELEVVGGRTIGLTAAVMAGLVLVVVRVAFGVLTSWQSARLTSSVIAENRSALALGFLSASWKTQHSERTGQLQELLTTFSQQAITLISGLTTGTSSLFSLLALLAIAVAVDPPSALVTIVVVGVLGSLLRPIRASVRRRGRRSAEVGMHFATSLSEVSQLGLEMHVFQVQRQTGERVLALIGETAEAERRLSFARGLVPTIYTGLAYSALVGALGAVALVRGASLVALGSVILLMLRSLSYGQSLQSAQAGMSSSLPYLERLKHQLDIYDAGRPHEGRAVIEHVGRLDLRNVTFSYGPGRPVLRDLSFHIAGREVVGIVGPSGSGKSTLVQLLLGLRDPDSGEILASGRPIRSVSKETWARLVTFVPQAAHLVAGTIYDNIVFYRDGVTDEMVRSAATLANLTEEIEQMPGGFNRQVGERGGHLSGGQQQRLCIARALVESPDVLILDEPTSALDAKSEYIIRETLAELSARMTVIVIAHRLSTLDICDRILVLQDGVLMGFDTPENLATTNDFYIESLRLSGLQ